MGIVRDMGDLQREIDKSRKLAYNILIKTASKGSQGSPSWQDICLRRSRLFFTREQGGCFFVLFSSLQVPDWIHDPAFTNTSSPVLEQLCEVV